MGPEELLELLKEEIERKKENAKLVEERTTSAIAKLDIIMSKVECLKKLDDEEQVEKEREEVYKMLEEHGREGEALKSQVREKVLKDEEIHRKLQMLLDMTGMRRRQMEDPTSGK